MAFIASPQYPTPQLLDQNGHPVLTPAEASVSNLGSIRTRRNGVPQILVNGQWVDLPKGP